MQIDLAGASPNGAPSIESTGASPEASKTHGSFADMLDAVAEDQNESATAEETDEDDLTGDEWMTVPVVVPFVPVIPQDVVKAEDGDATSVEAIGEDLAVAGAEAGTEVAALPDVKSIVDGETPKSAETKPQSEPMLVESPAVEGRVVVESDFQTIVAASEPGTAAPVDAKESTPTDAAPKPEKAVKAAAQKTPEASDVNQAVAAESTVTSVIQSAVTERVGSTEEASAKNATNEPVAGAKGLAARFARALERASEQTIAPTAQSGENNQAANQNGGGQPSFGEWLREQLPQLNAPRGHNAANPAFTFVAPAQNDARVSSLLASPGPNLTSNTPALLNEPDVNLQIVQSMRMQFRDGIGEAVLKLNPEHLGSVSISLKVENGGLKANVQADMPAVRQWLESQQDSLRSALAEHGLRLDQFDVEPDAQRQQADDEGQREQSRKRQAQKREAEQPVFEVVV
jgi:flagellar hook-length control protein FliK